MSLLTIDYKFCGLGTAVSKVGDAVLSDMEQRNPWVWGALRNEIYYCYIRDATTCQLIPVHIPPVDPIVTQLDLTTADVITQSTWRYHYNQFQRERFLLFVSNNNISESSTFYQCVTEWMARYNAGYGAGDDTIHALFSVPQISTNTVLRPVGRNDEIYIWKRQDGIPVAGRLITRNFVEETYAYQCPSVVISVCYKVTLICAATLVNFYLCRPSLMGQGYDGLFSETVYPVPAVCGIYDRYCGVINFSNPWIVDTNIDMSQWALSPLVTGSDFEMGICPTISVHPHPYTPKELVDCNGVKYMTHLGSASDFNCCATYYFGSDFYFFCYLLNVVSPKKAEEFYRELQQCEALVTAMVPCPTTLGEPLRIGKYYSSSGEIQYLNAGVFNSYCCYLLDLYSRAEVNQPPDYHEVIGCNIVVGTEEGGALHSKYNGCVIPSVCVQDWYNESPMVMRWSEFVTNASVQVTIKVDIIGDKQSFAPSGEYYAQLKHAFVGADCWGLYDADGNRCISISPDGGNVDVTDIVTAGGGTVTYNIGAECPAYGVIADPLNLAGTNMFFGVSGFDEVELGNFDKTMDLDNAQVILPNAKFINDF